MMEEIMLDIRLNNPVGNLDESMRQMGFKPKGEFKYDHPHSGHKWCERIRTELYEKDNQLFYFASVIEWDEGLISVVRIGKVENKVDKNPEIITE